MPRECRVTWNPRASSTDLYLIGVQSVRRGFLQGPLQGGEAVSSRKTLFLLLVCFWFFGQGVVGQTCHPPCVADEACCEVDDECVIGDCGSGWGM